MSLNYYGAVYIMSSLTLVIYVVIILILARVVYMDAGGNEFAGSILPSRSTMGPSLGATMGQSIQGLGTQGKASSVGAASRAHRTLGEYRDVTYDASSFDLAEARELAKTAYESDVEIVVAPTPRTSASATGGSNATIENVTGRTTVRPIVDNVVVPPVFVAPPPPPPAPPVVESPVAPPSIPERPDFRCGPNFNGAKCGPGRCCSIWGWCGSQGEPHCLPGINAPAYNGPSV